MFLNSDTEIASHAFVNVSFNFLALNESGTEFARVGERRKTGASALCTMDDANCFHMIRLELKTSVYEMNVTVVSTVTGCDVTTVQQYYKGSTSRISFRSQHVRPDTCPSLQDERANTAHQEPKFQLVLYTRDVIDGMTEYCGRYNVIVGDSSLSHSLIIFAI